MNAQQLLAELGLLTHDQRVQRMIALGRSAASDTQAHEIIRCFEAGDFYERYFALIACYGSRDGQHALRAARDPSRHIRALALRLVAELSDDDQALQALHAVPTNQRITLLWRLRKRKRQEPIDRFIGDLAASGDQQLGQLVCLASAATIEQHLEPIEQALGANDWQRLARLHPERVQQRLQRQAAAADRLDNRLIYLANAVLPTLADLQPDSTLELVQTLQRHIGLDQLELAQLVLRRPIAMANLVLAASDRVHVRFDRVAHRLEQAQLLALLQRRSELLADRRTWFRRLPAERRLAVYALAERGWRNADGVLDHAIASLLPGEARHAEARRHLALPALQTTPIQRLPYAALLPWGEAYAELERFVRNPDPVLRATAQTALALAARFNRSHLPDLLANIRARKNEQDPIRLAMISGLANLPPARWQAEQLDEIGQIIRDALNAADLSQATANAIERLLFAILPFYAVWSAQWLATLVQSRGQLSFTNLVPRINDNQMQQIAPLLVPVLQSWATREREYPLLAIAQCFGCRIEHFPALLDILERMLIDTRTNSFASAALNIFAAHQYKRLAKLVPRLLAADKTWITQPVVYTFLHRQRQDIITPFLGQNAYKGRFSTGKTRYVLPLDTGFHRWTPAQQALFARTLEALTRDIVRDMPSVFRAINQLSHMPALPPTRIVELASASMENLAVRDTAIRALGHLDGSDGIQPLLECMADDRARVAIYALRRSLLQMPSDRALALLQAVPLERVTVAKEVVRLIGDLQSDAGYQKLLALSEQPLHRDVRVALLRALWEHIERDQTWPIIDAAAVDSDPAVAHGVVSIPADRLSARARQRLARLLALLLGHPDPEVRIATLNRCSYLPTEDSEQRLLEPLTQALGSTIPAEYEAAARAVFATYVGRNATAIGTVVQAIRSQRRALLATTQVLQNRAYFHERLLPTVRSVLAALTDDPLTAHLQVGLALAALPWQELPPLLEHMAHIGQFHADVLQAAEQALPQAARRSNAEALAAFETDLAASANADLRRLALATLRQQATDVHGWTDERLARLARFRTDAAPIVAAAAQFIFPPEEADTSAP